MEDLNIIKLQEKHGEVLRDTIILRLAERPSSDGTQPKKNEKWSYYDFQRKTISNSNQNTDKRFKVSNTNALSITKYRE